MSPRELLFGGGPVNQEFSQLRQAVAPLPGGGFAVVWLEGEYTSQDVRMQWVGVGGTLVFGPGGVAVAHGPADEDDAVVAAHPASGAFVAFRQELPDRSARIVVQRYDAAGHARWPGGVIAAVPPVWEIQGSPRLVAGSDGGVFVCFEAYRGTSTDGIRCQHLDSGGHRSWRDAGQEVGGVKGWRVLPRGVSDGRDGLLVFWRNQRTLDEDPPPPMLMEGQHFASDGTKLWGSQGRVVRTTNLAASNEHSFTFFDVVSDGSGGAVLAFNDWSRQSDAQMDVLAQRVAGDGTLLWGAGSVVTGDAGHQQHETTVGAPDGGVFVVVFEEASPSRSTLEAYRLGPEGGHLWPAAGTPVSDPQAAALDYGAFGSFDRRVLRLIWTHQNSPGTLQMDVNLARFTLAGERLDPPAGRPLTAAPSGQFARGFADDSAGSGFLAVWDDLRASGSFESSDTFGAYALDASTVPAPRPSWLVLAAFGVFLRRVARRPASGSMSFGRHSQEWRSGWNKACSAEGLGAIGMLRRVSGRSARPSQRAATASRHLRRFPGSRWTFRTSCGSPDGAMQTRAACLGREDRAILSIKQPSGWSEQP